MTLKGKKEFLLSWTDSAGYDIAANDKINEAECDEDLRTVMEEHKEWLHGLCNDTIRSVDDAMNEIDV